MGFVLIFLFIQVVFHFLGVNKRIHQWALNHVSIGGGESHIQDRARKVLSQEAIGTDFCISSSGSNQTHAHKGIGSLSDLDEDEESIDENDYMNIEGLPLPSNKTIHSFMQQVHDLESLSVDHEEESIAEGDHVDVHE